MPAAEPLHAHTTRRGRHAPDANGSPPQAVGDERKAEGPIGELRLTVAKEEAGLERGGEPARLRSCIPYLEPDRPLHPLLPEDVERLLEPAGMAALRHSMWIRRLAVPPDLSRP